MSDSFLDKVSMACCYADYPLIDTYAEELEYDSIEQAEDVYVEALACYMKFKEQGFTVKQLKYILSEN